ncbi:MAG: thioredoxin family protein [Polyangiaceae bacterium]
MKLGDPCPDFRLPGTDGKEHTLDEFRGQLLVVVVSCNHCPYVVAYETRMVALAREFSGRGVDWVAINANDVARYPEDGMPKMVERAAARGFPFPYLRDDTQSTVRALGARFTPEVFVFDAARALRYHGRIDDNHRDEARVTSPDLRNAVDALLAGRTPAVAETVPVGCSVKWR